MSQPVRPPTDAVVAVRQALGASTSQEDFDLYCARMLAEADNALIARCTAIADRAEADCARAIQQCRNSVALLEGVMRRAGLGKPVSANATRARAERGALALVRGAK